MDPFSTPKAKYGRDSLTVLIAADAWILFPVRCFAFLNHGDFESENSTTRFPTLFPRRITPTINVEILDRCMTLTFRTILRRAA